MPEPVGRLDSLAFSLSSLTHGEAEHRPEIKEIVIDAVGGHRSKDNKETHMSKDHVIPRLWHHVISPIQ
jgi:hypothetical protein